MSYKSSFSKSGKIVGKRRRVEVILDGRFIAPSYITGIWNFTKSYRKLRQVCYFRLGLEELVW